MTIDPDDIKLSDLNKMLVYEQQARIIDKLDGDEGKAICESYCKLFLQQQELVGNLAKL
jgi:hypothetical protein